MTADPIQLDACCAPLSDADANDEMIEQLVAVFKALADPVRLRVLSLVAAAPGREVCACDLPALLDRSQPTVSHHLGILVNAGVLEREQRGKWAWFRLRPDQLTTLCRVLGTATG